MSTPLRKHPPKRPAPVKLSAEAYFRVRRLAAKAEEHGWKSLGADRTDKVSLSTVVDEATKRMEQEV